MLLQSMGIRGIWAARGNLLVCVYARLLCCICDSKLLVYLGVRPEFHNYVVQWCALVCDSVVIQLLQCMPR